MEHQQYLVNWAIEVQRTESSFVKNSLGWLIYGYVRAYKPQRCVEFGVLHGYSTLFIGGALRDNDLPAMLESFDRWPGHLPGLRDQVAARIEACGMNDLITLTTLDVLINPPDLDDIDFLMVDLNNTAETLEWIMNRFAPKMSEKGFMIFEGGSEERDHEVWIEQNRLTPIKEAFQNWVWDNWQFHVIEPWPSMTVITRR